MGKKKSKKNKLLFLSYKMLSQGKISIILYRKDVIKIESALANISSREKCGPIVKQLWTRFKQLANAIDITEKKYKEHLKRENDKIEANKTPLQKQQERMVIVRKNLGI